MRVDLILENNDLKIDANDFLISTSDQQNAELAIYSEKGWYKLSPFFGAGINSKLNSTMDINAITRLIKQELSSDGYPNANVLIQGDKISVAL
jgi:hypothetical protein